MNRKAAKQSSPISSVIAKKSNETTAGAKTQKRRLLVTCFGDSANASKQPRKVIIRKQINEQILRAEH